MASLDTGKNKRILFPAPASMKPRSSSP